MVGVSFKGALRLGVALAAMSVCGATSAAPVYQTLYSFTGAGDGAAPVGALAIDESGNVYGTAPSGGVYGFGTAYRIAPDGSIAMLHQFKAGRDGAMPMSGLVKKGRAFYGTTAYGGVANGGTVYKLRSDGRTKILHSFGLGEDGFTPSAGVTFDTAGNLFGTTELGGGSTACGCGTVYKLAPDGGESVLHVFTGGNDGKDPMGSVTPDGNGNLFGTTYTGGAQGFGTVFEVAADGGESVLHAFSGEHSGAYPAAGLVRDAQGNLYGTTEFTQNAEKGTIFEVGADGTTTTLHAMAGHDGYLPTPGNLVRDAQGNLYGTTQVGGSQNCGFGEGCGTLFVLASGGKFKVLHFFGGGTDGFAPQSGLVSDKHGTLYGTTTFGGTFGHGTVFKISN